MKTITADKVKVNETFIANGCEWVKVGVEYSGSSCDGDYWTKGVSGFETTYVHPTETVQIRK
jgi:hypothetical protein